MTAVLGTSRSSGSVGHRLPDRGHGAVASTTRSDPVRPLLAYQPLGRADARSPGVRDPRVQRFPQFADKSQWKGYSPGTEPARHGFRQGQADRSWGAGVVGRHSSPRHLMQACVNGPHAVGSTVEPVRGPAHGAFDERLTPRARVGGAGQDRVDNTPGSPPALVDAVHPRVVVNHAAYQAR